MGGESRASRCGEGLEEEWGEAKPPWKVRVAEWDNESSSAEGGLVLISGERGRSSGRDRLRSIGSSSRRNMSVTRREKEAVLTAVSTPGPTPHPLSRCSLSLSLDTLPLFRHSQCSLDTLDTLNTLAPQSIGPTPAPRGRSYGCTAARALLRAGREGDPRRSLSWGGPVTALWGRLEERAGQGQGRDITTHGRGEVLSPG